MFLAAADPDLVANDPAPLFNDRCKSPLLFDPDVFNNIDSLSVLLRLNHLHSPKNGDGFLLSSRIRSNGYGHRIGGR